MKFRAAVLDQVGSRLSIDTLELGDLAPNDVLVRMRASGLCHTDLEVIEGSLAYPMPIGTWPRRGGRGGSGRPRRESGESRRPRDPVVESALRSLLLLRS